MKTKTKVISFACLLLAGLTASSGLVLTMERDNGKTTYRNWWDCHGIGSSLERESDYSILYNTCVTIRVNEDGSETRVNAALDVGLEGVGG